LANDKEEAAMKLSRIRLENLFGQFDYDIMLNREEGITILTGPNGYGKTTILNIIYDLFSGGRFSHCPGGTVMLSDDNVDSELKFPENLKDIINKLRVYPIKDQRLDQETVPKFDGTFKYDGTIKANGAAVLVKTISLYSGQLAASVLEKKKEEQQLADKLASSQHNRIKALSGSLDEGEFRKRFSTLREKYRQLQNIGIYTMDLEDTDYKDNKGYLSVFLQDWEKRISVYDDLVLRINLFLSILNRKPLVNKTISIQTNEGFCFTSSNGKRLRPIDLSSGEQNQIIIQYELLFKAPPGSLVLIDEPETSMHVAWQLDFLQDIEKIAKLSGLSFIIATHSPDLINDKMDACIDLFENTRRNGNHGK
jgi:predicted ATP-binding protein involved in virulence